MKRNFNKLFYSKVQIHVMITHPEMIKTETGKEKCEQMNEEKNLERF